MASAKPRCVLLNNPGSVEHGDPWQGLSASQPDAVFCNFVSPAWGFRAIAQILCVYQDRYGIKTISAAIARWAPPNENDTAAYIAAVAKDSRLAADEVVNFHDYNDAYPIIRAITIHEQGSFENFFTKSQLDVGCIKAGLQNAPRGIAATAVKGVAGVTGVAAAAAASNPDVVIGAYNTLKPIVDASPHAIQTGFWGVVVCAFVGIAAGEFIRIKNRKG